jgi:hypothetical protein
MILRKGSLVVAQSTTSTRIGSQTSMPGACSCKTPSTPDPASRPIQDGNLGDAQQGCQRCLNLLPSDSYHWLAGHSLFRLPKALAQ